MMAKIRAPLETYSLIDIDILTIDQKVKVRTLTEKLPNQTLVMETR
jgi:hypothetical protein